ncbi:hypothetical protein SAMN04489761_1179 [Tenacibaculum sp. MAR_2009_124]|uniref:hypothetical protein n=1 Tax=Tenacibaculum sp. MAR_2009_124 TaxID=1250059 RepID=UPI00089931EA|nr:hypothetical protein [Tenacibaculum sp. MAR_2009_124]SEB51934.1 hypothetical protein SAMN04489761_1179 [Tenacibaculum sp. MAR_2009_124]
MPTDHIDLKNIWKQQKAEAPDIKELTNKIKKMSRKNRLKIIATNALFTLTILFIVGIWYFYNPKLITSKIGMILTILSMIFFVLYYNKLFTMYKKLNDFEKNKEYLQNLIRIKKQQKELQTKIMGIYYILLSLGLALYMYEYIVKMTLWLGIVCSTLTIIWVAFNWFYLRPKIAKKEQQKLDIIIDQYEKVNLDLAD